MTFFSWHGIEQLLVHSIKISETIYHTIKIYSGIKGYENPSPAKKPDYSNPMSYSRKGNHFIQVTWWKRA